MKIIKFVLFSCLFIFYSCNKEETQNTVVYPLLLHPIEGTFNLMEVEKAIVSFETEIAVQNTSLVVDRVQWFASYEGINGNMIESTLVSDIDISTFEINPFSNWPRGTFEFSLVDIVQNLGLDISDVNVSDIFRFESKIIMDDGSIFTVQDVDQGLLDSQSNILFQFEMVVFCFENLEGTFEFVTEPWCGNTAIGTIDWVLTEDGNYILDNGSTGYYYTFGAYTYCYGDSDPYIIEDFKIIQDCNRIYPSGTSPIGDQLEYVSVQTNGADLTIEWINIGYEQEFGTTILTRTDGKDWPDLTN